MDHEYHVSRPADLPHRSKVESKKSGWIHPALRAGSTGVVYEGGVCPKTQVDVLSQVASQCTR